ncbi:MAG: sensor histidine kinase, partial [Gemmiger sp.]|nr:sensor histidine kinase [Gemmiger sp.]
HQIHDLTEKLFRANTDLYESELLAKQSELSHLRSQINPHFLYNTLETMVGIAYTNGQPEIAEIARSLSIIFKYSIKGDDVVPLAIETKITRNYIHIQHYRFSDRFEALFHIDEDCLADMVPKLILQPLIENAIVHGIEQQQAFCQLTLSARHLDGCLVLTVEDDGAGIPADTLAELQEKLQVSVHAASRVGNTAHIGVVNVDSRIKLMYGEEYGIQMDSLLGKGTKVTLRLPIRKGADPCTK